jgi:putative ABC transport system substrate-binding protein
VHRIGWLSGANPPTDAEIEKDWAPLRQLGWIEGKNIVVERRFPSNDAGEPLTAAAQELVRMKVDLIVADGTPAIIAAKKATATIPIVMTGAGDPVGTGLIASLAHPGGNVTGYSTAFAETSVKRAVLLKELLPSLKRVAFLFVPSNPVLRVGAEHADTAYRSLGVEPIMIDPYFLDAEEILTEALRWGAQAMDVPMPLDPEEASAFMKVAMRFRMPVISGGREVPDAGGLASFEVDFDEAPRRVAVIIDKLLRGAKPEDIPVEEPTRFRLIVNLKAAKELGITVPQSLVMRADEVIR